MKETPLHLSAQAKNGKQAWSFLAYFNSTSYNLLKLLKNSFNCIGYMAIQIRTFQTLKISFKKQYPKK